MRPAAAAAAASAAGRGPEQPDSLAQVLRKNGQLSCDGTPINHIVSTYGEAEKGSIVGLAGSQGFVEIAVVEGRADKYLNARIGTPVQIAR